MAIKKIHKKCFLLLLAFGAFLCLEILLNTLLSQFIVDDNYNFEEVTPMNFRRLTIQDLIAGSGNEIKNLLKKSTKEIIRNVQQDSEEFHYQKISCKNMLLIKGMHNQFRICYPIRWFLRFQQQQQLAYFINGPRDIEFERNFKKVADNVVLKVFTKQNTTTIHQYYSFTLDNYRNIDVNIFSEVYNANRSNVTEIGIKDLIDSQDDYHHMEFMKYEMKNKIDSIVFSINIPVFSSHLLLRLENIAFNEFEHLIKRLEKVIYFPYSIIKQQKDNAKIMFISFMHKYSFYKYGIGEPVEAIMQKDFFYNTQNNVDEL